jgi:D-glycero-D-manno-heptose 1,7-bisphosphate phosphatase
MGKRPTRVVSAKKRAAKSGATHVAKRPAIFLDRDGTIIRHVDLLHKLSDVRLLPGAAKAIQAMNRKGFFTVIISNQPAIARGVASMARINEINDLVIHRLKKKGARVDALYFCPHHPEGVVKEYSVACDCRKPSPGMILAAAEHHNLHLKKSFMIGDSSHDVQAANRAKVKAVLVKTGHGGKDKWQFEGEPDFVAKNLREAVQFI